MGGISIYFYDPNDIHPGGNDTLQISSLIIFPTEKASFLMLQGWLGYRSGFTRGR